MQAALCFSVAHVFVRRGLIHSNALTGSVISLGTSAAIFCLLAIALVPFDWLRSPAVGYFVAAGVFAPAIGQTLGYIGMERIGVARASPIVNTSPIFSSMFAVLFLGEIWAAQNILGTCLVILGVVVLSSSAPAEGNWRKKDLLYPVLAAMAFGVSTILRKRGLLDIPVPLLAAAVTVSTAFLFLAASIGLRGGLKLLRVDRQGGVWLAGAAVVNAGAILSFFSALNAGQIVRVEPLVACNPLLTILWTVIFLRAVERITARIVVGGLVTVTGTVLVVTAQ